ncbi:hypothetical protein U3516DRAFT_654994 [Neocallimastix sp. 'constans']
MDINQDNLIEKLQLLKLLIQKGRFEIGVSDDVNELDEFVDGESMGILALVDNKEARKINNNNSPVDFSNIINVDSDKEIKIEKIKKKIKITHIFIQNNVNKKWALTLKVHNSSNRRDGGLKIAKRKIISSSYEVSKPPRCRDIYI